mgnify:CR=1 FL=1
MVEYEFYETRADHYVFVKRYDEGDFIVLLLYVDDMLIASRSPHHLSVDLLAGSCQIHFINCPTHRKLLDSFY